MISHFYPVQWFCHDREKHTNDSECRENTWNYPAFHSLLSLHSLHSQRVPFISINHNPISPFESPFHSFHCLSLQCHPSILLYPFHFISTTSIPLHLQLPHHLSTHLHTTPTTQIRSNTYNPFCVELGTPNTNNSRKLLDLCVCLFKAHFFFYSTCLVSLTSTSRILLVSCSARAKSPNCLISFQRTRLCT